MKGLGVSLCLLLLPAASHANDGWFVYLGSEKSLRPHPSVRMVKEYITIDVGDRCAWVTCTFWFRNSGPATTVKMAYPDESSSSMDGQPYSQLREFRSWVDGARVPTQFKLLDRNGYQIKTVRFARDAARQVVNRYRVPLGLVASRGQVYVQDLGYTFSTGASWKGKIGRGELVVRFRGRFQPTRLLPTKTLEQDGPRSFWRNNLTSLFWKGPSGTLSGNQYRIVRRDWRPTEADNVVLQFRPFTIDWDRGSRKDFLK
jgi:hypothetical protein